MPATPRQIPMNVLLRHRDPALLARLQRRQFEPSRKGGDLARVVFAHAATVDAVGSNVGATLQAGENDHAFLTRLWLQEGIAWSFQFSPIWSIASGVPMDILMPDGSSRIPLLGRNAGGRQFHTGRELIAPEDLARDR